MDSANNAKPAARRIVNRQTVAAGIAVRANRSNGRQPVSFQHNMLLVWAAVIEHSPQLLDATVTLLWPLVWPMLAGSIPLGLLTGAVVYYICKNGVQAWRDRRMTRLSTPAE